MKIKQLSIKERRKRLGELVGYAELHHFNPLLIEKYKGQLIGLYHEIA